ncbi:BQ2448_8000 [Microbotryum intermedium]|uniref:BQ2448_8000 protein n=1 Tax=Microbotryum intermedium TaxID=269621 RepID=A0A238FRY5_9BASI|nr:BQ2448_8000 [Microbotryum intermedium]
MVQLWYTQPFQTRLDGLDLPQELRELITSQIVAVESSTSDADDIAERSRTISHEALVKVSRWSKTSQDSRRCTLASLLALTDVHAPPLKPREKSPELLAILAKIQLDQDRESYKAMTSTAPTPYYRSSFPMKDLHGLELVVRTTSEAEDWQLVRKQVSAIANVGASMGAVGTGVWWVGGGRTYAARLVLALTGAVLIGLIEAFLYYRFFTREQGSIGVGLTKTKPLRFESKHAVPQSLLGPADSSNAKKQE